MHKSAISYPGNSVRSQLDVIPSKSFVLPLKKKAVDKPSAARDHLTGRGREVRQASGKFGERVRPCSSVPPHWSISQRGFGRGRAGYEANCEAVEQCIHAFIIYLMISRLNVHLRSRIRPSHPRRYLTSLVMASEPKPEPVAVPLVMQIVVRRDLLEVRVNCSQSELD